MKADDLERLISRPRFAIYVAECAGDRDRAAALYRWNADLAGALHVELGFLEVAFRNRLNDALASHHARLRGRPPGVAWFDGPRWVSHHWWDQPAQAAIDEARRRAGHRPPRSSQPDGVVAELSFGFWRSLVGARYEQSLWEPVLDGAFLGIPGRTPGYRRLTLEERVRVLVRLRNRVAHHEPLFRPAQFLRRGRTPVSYSIDQQVTMIHDVLSWIDATAVGWVSGTAQAIASCPSSPPAP